MDRDEAEVGATLDDDRARGDRLREQSNEGPLAPVLAQLADVVELREVVPPSRTPSTSSTKRSNGRETSGATRSTIGAQAEPAREPGEPFERRQCRELRLHGSPATLPDTLLAAR